MSQFFKYLSKFLKIIENCRLYFARKIILNMMTSDSKKFFCKGHV